MQYIFCDLDMTLVDTKQVINTAGPEPTPGSPEHDAWRTYVTNPNVLKTANPVYSVKYLLQYFLGNQHVPSLQLKFVTSRRESTRDITQRWLLRHGFPGNQLLMRPEDCLDNAGTLKARIINSIVDKTDLVVIIDDDPDGTIETACKEYGWTHLKVTNY